MPKGIYNHRETKTPIYTKERNKKVGDAISGENHFKWKGNDAGKLAMHRWVEKWKGKPSECEVCGTTKATRFEWANIDHKYKRILEDYIRMCPPCHRQYDIKNNNWGKTPPN